MSAPALHTLPDAIDNVWAFSDVHGVRSALVLALRQAGLIDEAEHWCAPAGTALVGCGDYLDRGTDSVGLIELLRRLQREAPVVGGQVALARGNHEQMLLDSLEGSNHDFAIWLSNGGDATCASAGVGAYGRIVDRATICRTLEARLPWLHDWLDSLPQAVAWRDVLFVHAGAPDFFHPADYGQSTRAHLWTREAFFGLPRLLHDPRSRGLYAAGLDRVVFGHSPMSGPRTFHDERSLNLDTNACANFAFDPRDPAPPMLTLAHIPAVGSLAAAQIVAVDTSEAPDRMRR